VNRWTDTSPSRRAEGRRRLPIFLAAALAVAITAAAEEPTRRAPAAPTLPAGAATLSLLEPRAGGGCDWIELEAASGRRRVRAAFPGGCLGGTTVLARDGKQGAVWFAVGEYGGPRSAPPSGARLYIVDLACGGVTQVPVPEGMRDLGFDRAGRLLSLTLQSLTEAELERGEALVDGKPVRLEKPLDGVPVLAHAFVLESRRWHRVETVNSTDAWDLALGVKGLAAAHDLGFRSAETLVPQVQGDEEDDGALLAQLARFAPQVAALSRGDGGWIRDGWADTRFVLWEERGEFGYSTGLAAFVDRDGNPHPPAEWPFARRCGSATGGTALTCWRPKATAATVPVSTGTASWCGHRARRRRPPSGRVLVWRTPIATSSLPELVPEDARLGVNPEVPWGLRCMSSAATRVAGLLRRILDGHQHSRLSSAAAQDVFI
jgi:hypothetical protein